MGFYYIALGASWCHLGLQIKRTTFNWAIPTSGSSLNRSDPTRFATKPSELRHRRSTKLMVYFHHSHRSKLRDFDGGQEFHFYNSLSLPQFGDDFLKQLQNVYSWMLGGITKWWAKAWYGCHRSILKPKKKNFYFLGHNDVIAPNFGAIIPAKKYSLYREIFVIFSEGNITVGNNMCIFL